MAAFNRCTYIFETYAIKPLYSKHLILDANIEKWKFATAQEYILYCMWLERLDNLDYEPSNMEISSGIININSLIFTKKTINQIAILVCREGHNFYAYFKFLF